MIPCYCPDTRHVIYHLTCDQFIRLLRASRLRCMCCDRRGPLEFDHDHAVGGAAVRGLLCRSCNQRLRYIDAGHSMASGAYARYLSRPFYRSLGVSGACPDGCAHSAHGNAGREGKRSRPALQPRGHVSGDAMRIVMRNALTAGEPATWLHSPVPLWRAWQMASLEHEYGSVDRRPHTALRRSEGGGMGQAQAPAGRVSAHRVVQAAVMTLMVLAGLAMLAAAWIGATATTMDTVILMVVVECVAAVVVIGLAGLSW